MRFNLKVILKQKHQSLKWFSEIACFGIAKMYLYYRCQVLSSVCTLLQQTEALTTFCRVRCAFNLNHHFYPRQGSFIELWLQVNGIQNAEGVKCCRLCQSDCYNSPGVLCRQKAEGEPDLSCSMQSRTVSSGQQCKISIHHHQHNA